ncbi:pyridoxamine 5'-phosphate oxidase family protein [Nocardia australiensis]|uniref:pyridoxamine 5'-phosphate oxidase family protein n=1 Tax=Nocardia australiensis TaxID=2887191 RepID=UPI001D142C7F|nr:pyridoxamine 5'-phosphate oxidase family protein [Nocardia australiensis]
MTSPEPVIDGDVRRVVALDRDEAIRLLAGAAFGRVVFTRDALPAIRPVNHLVEHDGRIIIRTRLTSRLTSAIRPQPPIVVAYEADDIDTVSHIGWTVVVTGFAHAVTDPERIARYERVLRPCVAAAMDIVVEIEPNIVTGMRLIDKAEPTDVEALGDAR